MSFVFYLRKTNGATELVPAEASFEGGKVTYTFTGKTVMEDGDELVFVQGWTTLAPESEEAQETDTPS